MKKYLYFFIAAAACLISGHAQNVVIKSPGYFTEPIRNGQKLFPDSLVFPSDAEEIRIPDIGMIGRLGEYKFPKLKKITFGNIDYLPGGLLDNLPELEEVVFEGLVGHFDCTLAYNCPKLKKIVFKGPVGSTGGPGIVHNLPNLETIEFESVVGDLGVKMFSESECPKFKGFVNKGAFIKVYDEEQTSAAKIDDFKSNPKLIKDLEHLARWQEEVLSADNPGFMRFAEYQSARNVQPVLAQLNSPYAATLKSAMEYAWALGDDVKTKLDILKESPEYAADPSMNLSFRYAPSSDSLLTATRQRFNLDSIAGTGDDISKITNLLFWVHDNIPHDGSNGLAPGPRTLTNNYESCRRDSCGYNCRALAICLTEALLAVGIPSRYLTCLPKAWDTDNDCHVISVAWSESLGKWIWVDPTFAAFVTDENGLMLHPGEVRERLRKYLPLFINESANYNNRYKQDKEYYIDEYMAKNLYMIQANTFNQVEPEGKSSHPQGEAVTLVPAGVNYPYGKNTSDYSQFWQSPHHNSPHSDK